MSIDQLEIELTRTNTNDLIKVLRDIKLLKKIQKCNHCNLPMIEKKYKQSREDVLWRCNNKNCSKHRVRLSIRSCSFFDGVNLTILQILKVLLKWSINTPQASICAGMNIDSCRVAAFENDLKSKPFNEISLGVILFLFKLFI